ncbi:hypothetical protein D1115_03640 [Vibrio alfacsensis]|uniref:Pilus assembly protein E-set like domain-containing protein n=1 Tax=Vibrio alfacsensis TaxID=1074311 RepID=A0ABN5PDT6_9VIBR|nr:TcfC E-set like domain-containing protein [Vibrio alfacsensis]AXY00458.1 hypothetical protein D1115_03640 [Vibrio alfacsensis]
MSFDGAELTKGAGQIEYMFDYDNRTLTVFLSSDMFDYRTEEEFHSPYRESNALVNESDLYVFSSGANRNFNWSNDTTLGLPYGHINFDTQYSYQDQTLDVFTGVYDLDLAGHRLITGYQQLGSRYNSLNSTDFLNYGADYSGYMLTFGSSNNLVKGGVHSRNALGFYTPQSGQLEILRDGKIIYSQAVKQGQNSISYDALPKGVYTITLLVKQGEKQLVNETRSIVNNGDSTLFVGDFDYNVKVGALDKGEPYLEGALSHRLTERSLLGGSITSDMNSYMLRLGGKYHFNDISTVQYLGGFFDTGSSYYQGQLSVGPVGINMRRFDAKGSSVDLSQALYGEQDIVEYGVSYSAPILGGNAYMSYYHISIDDKDFETNSDNFSLSWSHSLGI